MKSNCSERKKASLINKFLAAFRTSFYPIESIWKEFSKQQKSKKKRVSQIWNWAHLWTHTLSTWMQLNASQKLAKLVKEREKCVWMCAILLIEATRHAKVDEHLSGHVSLYLLLLKIFAYSLALCLSVFSFFHFRFVLSKRTKFDWIARASVRWMVINHSYTVYTVHSTQHTVIDIEPSSANRAATLFSSPTAPFLTSYFTSFSFVPSRARVCMYVSFNRIRYLYLFCAAAYHLSSLRSGLLWYDEQNSTKHIKNISKS